MSEINDIKELTEGTFPINLKLIQIYQWEEPSIIAKYKNGKYHKGSYSGVINIDINHTTCEDKIFIMLNLQVYVLHWYHTYLFHPGMDRTEAMICRHFYWNNIRNAIRRELINCDTCQRAT